MCDKCKLGQLSVTVLGEGKLSNGLFIIGMNPGENEAIMKRPFVGESGELLNALLLLSGINRSDTYISNIVKCRTPNNREPVMDETRTCTKFYLERELAVGKPKVIVALGKYAISYFTEIKSVGDIRSKKIIPLIEYNASLIPTYHPSFYLHKGISPKSENLHESCIDMIDDLKRAKTALEIYKKYGKI